MGRWTSPPVGLCCSILLGLTGGCIDGHDKLGPVQHDVAGLLLGFCPSGPDNLDANAEGEVAVLPGDHPEAVACQTAQGEVDVLYRGPSFRVDDSTPRILYAEALETDQPDACPARLTEVGLVLFDETSRVISFRHEPPITREDGGDLRIGVFDMVTLNEGSLTVTYRHRLIDGAVSHKATFEADTGNLTAFPIITRDGCKLHRPDESEGRRFSYRVHAESAAPESVE